MRENEPLTNTPAELCMVTLVPLVVGEPCCSAVAYTPLTAFATQLPLENADEKVTVTLPVELNVHPEMPAVFCATVQELVPMVMTPETNLLAPADTGVPFTYTACALMVPEPLSPPVGVPIVVPPSPHTVK